MQNRPTYRRFPMCRIANRTRQSMSTVDDILPILHRWQARRHILSDQTVSAPGSGSGVYGQVRFVELRLRH